MPEPTIIAAGELLVEFVSHRTGCSLRELAEYSGPYPSGAPAIFIDQVARLGAQAKLFGSIGNDNFGASLVDRLQTNGVNTDSIVRLDHKTTGVAFVSYYDDGSRTFVFHIENTAADGLDPQDFELPPGPLLFHVSGSSLGNPTLRVLIERIAAEVLTRGGKISCDPNARAELMRDNQVRAVLERIMRQSTYLLPSTSDLEFLYPGKTEEQATDALKSYGAEIVVLKRADQGATLIHKESVVTLPGHRVNEVDPTGAGDCFCGAFLSMLTQGHSMEQATRHANAAGALAVMRRGPMEGNSNLDQIENFLASRSNTD